MDAPPKAPRLAMAVPRLMAAEAPRGPYSEAATAASIPSLQCMRRAPARAAEAGPAHRPLAARPALLGRVTAPRRTLDNRQRSPGWQSAVATPTSTTVGVTRLVRPDLMIEIEAVAVV